MLDTIHHFPAPIGNEHLLSCLMRYASTQGRKEFVRVAKTVSLNVSKISNESYWRPVYTDVLKQYLPKFHYGVAKENTLLNVFSQFAGVTFDSLLSDQIVKPEKLQFKYEKIGQVSAGWNWCSQCAKEDEMQHGFAYWHRDHQFSLKHRCSKHDERLLTSCNHCGYEYLSVLQGPPPHGDCVKCGKGLKSIDLPETELWLENAANRALDGSSEINIAALKAIVHERYGFDKLKRNWSLAERKQITIQQRAFGEWLDGLNLTYYLAQLKNNKPYSQHLAFNLSSFAFNQHALPPIVILLLSRFLEDESC